MSGSRASNVMIRAAEPRDCAAIASLAGDLRRALADPVEHMTEAAILRDGFGPAPAFRILVAAKSDALAGYALFTDAYEPAYAARGVYLADLYVAPCDRGHGIGRALVEAVGAAARTRGGTFVWWVAQARNEAALAFYRRLAPDFRHEVVAHALVLR